MITAAVFALGFLALPARADDTPHLVGTPAVPMISAEHASKLREEIRINEGRAKELEPIIARDRQARNDVESDWRILERHAKELHAKANDLRTIAGTVSGPAAQDLTNYANDFETFASHDEENAHFKHEVGERLEKNIQGEMAARDWHLKVAQRLREWLEKNGR